MDAADPSFRYFLHRVAIIAERQQAVEAAPANKRGKLTLAAGVDFELRELPVNVRLCLGAPAKPSNCCATPEA